MENEFLKKLEEDFYVEFDQDDQYVLDEKGRVTELYLWGHNKTYGVSHDPQYVSDISILLPLCSHLKVLHINNWTVEDMSPLKHFSQLKELSLSGNNRIKNISGIEDLVALEYLDLSYNRIENIIGLEKLTKLKMLNLSANGIGSKGYIKKIEGLSSLLNLEGLYLQNNRITTIENINHLTKLKRLQVHQNEINDLENIDSLTDLTRLTIGNNLSKFPDLNNHLQLEELGIIGDFNEMGNLNSHPHLHTLNVRAESEFEHQDQLLNIESLKNIMVNGKTIKGNISQTFWTSDK